MDLGTLSVRIEMMFPRTIREAFGADEEVGEERRADDETNAGLSTIWRTPSTMAMTRFGEAEERDEVSEAEVRLAMRGIDADDDGWGDDEYDALDVAVDTRGPRRELMSGAWVPSRRCMGALRPMASYLGREKEEWELTMGLFPFLGLSIANTLTSPFRSLLWSFMDVFNRSGFPFQTLFGRILKNRFRHHGNIVMFADPQD